MERRIYLLADSGPRSRSEAGGPVRQGARLSPAGVNAPVGAGRRYAGRIASRSFSRGQSHRRDCAEELHNGLGLRRPYFRRYWL